MSASTAAQARCTRSSGRTGPGSRRCSGSPAASSPLTRASSRSADAAEDGALPPRPGDSVSASHTRPTRMSSTCRWPRTCISPSPRDERPAYGRMETWAASTLEEFELDVSVTAGAGTLSLVQRQLLEVVKSLLAKPKVLLLDEPTTALGPQEVEQLHALVREQKQRRRRHRLREPPAAGGARDRRSHQRPSRRGESRNVRSRRDDRGRAGRAHDRTAAPARLPRARRGRTRARGAARGLGASRRPLRPHRPQGREGRDPRYRRRRGQRPGAVPARARRCRAVATEERPATATSSTRSRRWRPSAQGSCC